MTRLIDADALERAMYEEVFEKDTDMQRWDSGCWIRYKLFENVLDAQPTIDAVPVIRCKDCEFYDDGICHAEDERAYDLSENHYCGFGEPKENEHE